MILVFGGTTEGKQVAQWLDEQGVAYYYSTKTPVQYQGTGIPITGAMTAPMIQDFCSTHQVTHLINAAHPFAIQLHQTIIAAGVPCPLIRYQRAVLPRTQHPLVSYVATYTEALAILAKQQYTSLLALSGVQTITHLQPYWQQYPTWFRILDRDSSRAIARAATFPMEQLLFGYPQSTEEEIELYQQLQPQAIMTKESGRHGKLDQKIQAALSLSIPILILQQPKISNQYLCIDTVDTLTTILTQ